MARCHPELTLIVCAAALAAAAVAYAATPEPPTSEPVKLALELHGPDRLQVVDGEWQPVPFEVIGVLRNDGGAPAYAVSAQLVIGFGLRVAPGESDRRYIGTLRPGEEVRLRWLVAPTDVTGAVPYSLKVSYAGASELPTATRVLVIPPLETEILVTVGAGRGGTRVYLGEAVNVEIFGRNLPPFATARLDVAFDPEVVRLVGGALGVTRGSLRTGVFRVVVVDDKAGRVTVEMASPTVERTTESLLVLRLVAVSEGQGLVQVAAAEFRDATGQVVYRVTPQDSRSGLSVTVVPACCATTFSGPTGEPRLELATDMVVEASSPVYPKNAVVYGEEGQVVLVVTVGPDGEVRDVVVLEGSGSALLDTVARRWVQERWQFRPSSTGCPYQVLVLFEFTIASDDRGQRRPMVGFRLLDERVQYL